MSWEMTVPLWKLWICASLIFFAGYAVAAILFVSGGKRDAKALGDMGRTLQRKHGEGVFQDHDPEDQTLVVGEILREKKARTRTVEATENGTQKRVSKNV